MEPRDQRLADECAARAHRVFCEEGWTWGDHSEPPSLEEITEAIAEKIARVRDDPDCGGVRSGRIRVIRDEDFDTIYVSLDLGDVQLSEDEDLTHA